MEISFDDPTAESDPRDEPSTSRARYITPPFLESQAGHPASSPLTPLPPEMDREMGFSTILEDADGSRKGRKRKLSEGLETEVNPLADQLPPPLAPRPSTSTSNRRAKTGQDLPPEKKRTLPARFSRPTLGGTVSSSMRLASNREVEEIVMDAFGRAYESRNVIPSNLRITLTTLPNSTILPTLLPPSSYSLPSYLLTTSNASSSSAPQPATSSMPDTGSVPKTPDRKGKSKAHPTSSPYSFKPNLTADTPVQKTVLATPIWRVVTEADDVIDSGVDDGKRKTRGAASGLSPTKNGGIGSGSTHHQPSHLTTSSSDSCSSPSATNINADPCPATYYQPSHRRQEIRETRSRLKEREKFIHERYKLRGRLDMLIGMDAGMSNYDRDRIANHGAGGGVGGSGAGAGGGATGFGISGGSGSGSGKGTWEGVLSRVLKVGERLESLHTARLRARARQTVVKLSQDHSQSLHQDRPVPPSAAMVQRVDSSSTSSFAIPKPPPKEDPIEDESSEDAYQRKIIRAGRKLIEMRGMGGFKRDLVREGEELLARYDMILLSNTPAAAEAAPRRSQSQEQLQPPSSSSRKSAKRRHSQTPPTTHPPQVHQILPSHPLSVSIEPSPSPVKKSSREVAKDARERRRERDRLRRLRIKAEREARAAEEEVEDSIDMEEGEGAIEEEAEDKEEGDADVEMPVTVNLPRRVTGRTTRGNAPAEPSIASQIPARRSRRDQTKAQNTQAEEDSPPSAGPSKAMSIPKSDPVPPPIETERYIAPTTASGKPALLEAAEKRLAVMIHSAALAGAQQSAMPPGSQATGNKEEVAKRESRSSRSSAVHPFGVAIPISMGWKMELDLDGEIWRPLLESRGYGTAMERLEMEVPRSDAEEKDDSVVQSTDESGSDVMSSVAVVSQNFNGKNIVGHGSLTVAPDRQAAEAAGGGRHLEEETRDDAPDGGMNVDEPEDEEDDLTEEEEDEEEEEGEEDYDETESHRSASPSPMDIDESPQEEYQAPGRDTVAALKADDIRQTRSKGNVMLEPLPGRKTRRTLTRSER